MTSFWPGELDLQDTANPIDVLNEAKQQWEESSGNTLSLFFKDAESTSGGDLIYVFARHVPSGRSRGLLRIAHRKDTPFPLTILFESKDLPRYLQRSYAPLDIGVIAQSMQPRQVENPWVCDTPGEFRSKLARAFSEGMVIADIQSLISGGSELVTAEETVPDIEDTPQVDDDNASNQR